MKNLIVVSYGGGTNSKALLVGLFERSIRPDLILFADTGAELPETYIDIQDTSEWCVSIGFPNIITVQQVNQYGDKITLEQKCIEGKMLPSIAYGYKSCSLKFKRYPQDKYINNWPPAIQHWRQGGKVIKLIGYDADEERRAKILSDNKYDYQYLLIEWGWGRDECVAAIKRAGLNQPGKSACFFCPSSKKNEILQLKSKYPALMLRAITMEDNAELTSVKGLGRNYAWRDLAKSIDNQFNLFSESNIDIDCDCYDGVAA